MAGFCAAALVLIGASCRSEGEPAPPPETTGARAVLPSGQVYRLEVALTPDAQAHGLMFRESLREKSGMIFLFSDGQPHRFWMKNTMIPLDIIWMDAAGQVVFVSADTPPCTVDPCPSYGPNHPIASVLEIGGGMAKKEGVTVGSHIRLLDVPALAATPGSQAS